MKNLAVAEQFIYADPTPSVVIVGSSMAARLDHATPPPAAFNLALHGGSALTGLEIIRRSGNFPALILVESNMLERQGDTTIADSLFTPGVHTLKHWLPGLRYTYQPVNLLLSLVKNIADQQTSASQKPGILFPELLALNIRQYGINNSSDPIDAAQAATLASHVRYFADHGSSIVFFDMPVHPDISASGIYGAMDRQLRRLFPQTAVYRMTRGNNEKFQTSDGLHLDQAGTSLYSTELNSIIGRHLQLHNRLP